ncbi:MAG: 2OG-Fe(II) oxygenase family protein [Patescibacteria group bacterium]
MATDRAETLLTEGRVWLPVAGLQEVLTEVLRRFSDDVLANIDWDDLRAGKYTFWCQEPQEQGTDEPDDGLIYKCATDKSDPSIARTGKRPDHKVYMQWRWRTERLLRSRPSLYKLEFKVFFEIMAELQELLTPHIDKMWRELQLLRPELQGFEVDQELSSIRVMRYLGVRDDESSLIGKTHTDRGAFTCHLGDSAPGLVVQNSKGEFELVPTTPEQTLIFTGDALARLTDRPAVVHGAAAGADAKRSIVVAFVWIKAK